MIQAFVGMVRLGQTPLEEGRLGETNEGRIHSTKAKDPSEDDGEEKEENESLKVEILQDECEIAKNVNDKKILISICRGCDWLNVMKS